MSFGQPSWVAVRLLGSGLARYVVDVRVEIAAFGSTTGPWGGIGGSAISNFTMTYLLVHAPAEFVTPRTWPEEDPTTAVEVALFFADERLLGWATGTDIPPLLDYFPRIDDRMPFLDTDLDACPVVLARALHERDDSNSAPSGQGGPDT